MRSHLTHAAVGFCSLMLGMLVATDSLAGGSGGSAIANLPSLGGSWLDVYGLNATGQITGSSCTSGDLTSHAFLETDGVAIDLGTLGGSTSIGYAINKSGQVVGRASLSTYGPTHAFLSGAANLQDLGTLGGSFSTASAVNDAGQVAGSATVAGDTATVAFLYADGTMTNLGTLGGTDSFALALNNAGAVVGQSYTASGETHGFVYAGGSMTDVGTLGGTCSSAVAVNDAGVVVGESDTAGDDTHGFIYAGGVLMDIGTLGGSYSSAIAINNAGQAIGIATTLDDAEVHPFLYSGGTLTDLGTLGGVDSQPRAINNLGAVVGTADTPDGNYHAFLYQAGRMLDLNTLLPANSGWELTDAYFINDAGRVVGLGFYNGVYQWFVMDIVASNHPPVAVAGPDQTVDCAAQVILDGSQSSDPDNDPLTFEWSLGDYVLGTSSRLAVSLPLGTSAITLKVTDSCGASAQANLMVRVVDNTAPTVSCPAPITASADGNGQAPVPNVLAQVMASDNCTSPAALIISQNPAAGTLVGLGPHPITVTVSDPSGNVATGSTLFTVVDTTPPIISSTPSPVTVSADANGQAVVPDVLANVVAKDNCTPPDQLTLSQTPAAGTLVGTCRHGITITVTDASGNTSTANVSLTVADTTPPVIQTLTANPSVLAPANGKLVPVTLSVAATDNCDAAPANKIVSVTCNVPTDVAAIKITGNLTVSLAASKGPSGTARVYTIIVSSTDAAGNSSTSSVTVTVPGKK